MAAIGLAIIIDVGPGIGTAQARRFSAAGHPVALVARKLDFIKPLAAEINDAGGKATAHVADAGE